MVRRLLVIFSVALIAVSYLCYTFSGSDLLPEMDEGGFVLDYWTPSGSSLTETNRMISHVEQMLRSELGVADVITRVKSNFSAPAEPSIVAEITRWDAVVTGIGVLNPIGLDLASYWESLRHGRSGIRIIQFFDPGGLPVRMAGSGQLPAPRIDGLGPAPSKSGVQAARRPGLTDRRPGWRAG